MKCARWKPNSQPQPRMRQTKQMSKLSIPAPLSLLLMVNLRTTLPKMAKKLDFDTQCDLNAIRAKPRDYFNNL